MKKSHFIFLFFSFLTFSVSIYSLAQGAYIRVGGGYGIGVGKGTVNSYFQREIMINVLQQGVFKQDMVNILKIKDQDARLEFVNESFGEGGSFGIAGGYMFSGHIGVELEIASLMSKKIHSRWDIPEEAIILIDDKRASVFFINPSLVVSAGKKGINPYARLGTVVGIVPTIRSMEKLQYGIILTTDVEEKLKNGVAVGLSTAIGFTYPLGVRLSLFSEIKYTLLNYTPKQREITKVSFNGAEKKPTELYDFPIQNLEKSTIAASDNPLELDRQNAYSYPFSSLSLNIGLQLNFSKDQKQPRSRFFSQP